MGDSQVYGPPPEFRILFARRPKYRGEAEEAVNLLPKSANLPMIRKVLAELARAEDGKDAVVALNNGDGRVYKRELAAGLKALKTMRARFDAGAPRWLDEGIQDLEHRLRRRPGRPGRILWHYTRAHREFHAMKVSRPLATAMMRAVVNVPGPDPAS